MLSRKGQQAWEILKENTRLEYGCSGGTWSFSFSVSNALGEIEIIINQEEAKALLGNRATVCFKSHMFKNFLPHSENKIQMVDVSKLSTAASKTNCKISTGETAGGQLFHCWFVSLSTVRTRLFKNTKYS